MANRAKHVEGNIYAVQPPFKDKKFIVLTIGAAAFWDDEKHVVKVTDMGGNLLQTAKTDNPEPSAILENLGYQLETEEK